MTAFLYQMASDPSRHGFIRVIQDHSDQADSGTHAVIRMTQVRSRPRYRLGRRRLNARDHTRYEPCDVRSRVKLKPSPLLLSSTPDASIRPAQRRHTLLRQLLLLPPLLPLLGFSPRPRQSVLMLCAFHRRLTEDSHDCKRKLW